MAISKTSNYELIKVGRDEAVNFEAHQNVNMDTIDTALKANADTASTASGDVTKIVEGTTQVGDAEKWNGMERGAFDDFKSKNNMQLIAGALGWGKWGENHFIFDACGGVAPNGVTCDPLNPDDAWENGRPNVMAMDNTGKTHGVRVDRARNAEHLISNNQTYSIEDLVLATSGMGGSVAGLLVNNCNTVSTSSFGRIDAATENRPPFIKYGSLITIFSSYQYKAQIALGWGAEDKGKVAVRSKQAGTWTDWGEIFNTQTAAVAKKNENTTFDAGKNTTIEAKCNDDGIASFEAFGDTQGVGRFFAGQSKNVGFGFEYNGNGNPVTTGAGVDYFSIYKQTTNSQTWLLRGHIASNELDFRERPTVGGEQLAIIKHLNFTVHSTGWTASGDATYPYVKEIPLAGITAADKVDLTPHLGASIARAEAAGMGITETAEDVVKVYAKRVPTNNLFVSATIMRG